MGQNGRAVISHLLYFTSFQVNTDGQPWWPLSVYIYVVSKGQTKYDSITRCGPWMPLAL